jgi:7 transmembrane receptor (rhodopsin family)
MDFPIFASLGPSHEPGLSSTTPPGLSSTAVLATPTTTAPVTSYNFRYELLCKTYGTPSLWGPFVRCEQYHNTTNYQPQPPSPTSTPSLAAHTNDGSSASTGSFANALLENIVGAFESFRCDLKSTNSFYFDAIYQCNALTTTNDFDSNGSGSNSSFSDDSDIEKFTSFSVPTNRTVSGLCPSTVSLFVQSVVNPVSELVINLPKFFASNTTGPCVADPYQQFLNCNVMSNVSFYENDTFDLYNASVFQPIQCVLNLGLSQNRNYNNYVNNMYNGNADGQPVYEWSFLFVILFIIAGGLGNILVCLAVALDRKLQNVTNYFLLSLAIADLLVSLFVMPLGAIPGFLGKTLAEPGLLMGF